MSDVILWVPEQYLRTQSSILKVPQPQSTEEQPSGEAQANDPLWVIDEEETQDHWLEIDDPEGYWSAIVKWDGCVHFYRNYPLSEDEDEEDYLHICDLDDLIKRLEALKAVALKHFGEAWPRG